MQNVQIGDVVMTAVLVVISVVDIKKKYIGAIGIISVLLVMILCMIAKGDVSIYEIIPGIAVGITLIIVSVVTRQGFGLADAFIIMIISCANGIACGISVLMLSLVLVSGFSVVLMLLKKANRKTTIPFIPFICVGFMLTVIFGSGGFV